MADDTEKVVAWKQILRHLLKVNQTKPFPAEFAHRIRVFSRLKCWMLYHWNVFVCADTLAMCCHIASFAPACRSRRHKNFKVRSVLCDVLEALQDLVSSMALSSDEPIDKELAHFLEVSVNHGFHNDVKIVTLLMLHAVLFLIKLFIRRPNWSPVH
jgi:hypothetical protein